MGMLNFLAGALVDLTTSPTNTDLGVDAAIVEITNIGDALVYVQVDGDQNDSLAPAVSIPVPAQSTRVVGSSKAGNTKVRAKTNSSTATVAISGWR